MANSLYRRIQIFFRSLFKRKTQQSDHDEEIEFHIEELTEEFMEEGLSRTVARKKALKRFGSVEWIKDDTRNSWGMQRLVDSIRDFKFGLRLTLKHATPSILAVIVLALGIGISTIMFTTASKLRNTSGGVELNDNLLYIDREVGQKQGQPILARAFTLLQKEVDSLENLIGFGYRAYFFHLPSKKEEGNQYSGIVPISPWRISPSSKRAKPKPSASLHWKPFVVNWIVNQATCSNTPMSKIGDQIKTHLFRT